MMLCNFIVRATYRPAKYFSSGSRLRCTRNIAQYRFPSGTWVPSGTRTILSMSTTTTNTESSKNLNANEGKATESYPDNEDDYHITDDESADDEIFGISEDDEVQSINAAVRAGTLKVKVRQHVNPLASRYQIPMSLDSNWISSSFQYPLNPMHIDIGCAKGTWVLKYGQSSPNLNILGLEIRKPVVKLCLHRKKVWHLKNVHFLSSNANIDLQLILSSLVEKNIPINCVSVQFPDPHFKKRHFKRRVVNADLVKTLSRYLKTNEKVFIQSDILDVMMDMANHLKSSPHFDVCEGYDPEQYSKNKSPFPVETEREIATLAKSLPVYRLLFRRNEKEFSHAE